MSDFAELIRSVEEIRAQRFPELPASVIKQILEAESCAGGDRNTAIREIRRLVVDMLAPTEAPDASA
jgi:hypothetical protein